MQAILVDIGNSSIKLVIGDQNSGEFKSNEVLLLDSQLSDDSIGVCRAALKGSPISHCFVSSVNQDILSDFLNRLQDWLPNVDCRVLSADDVELKSNVQSRQRLGIDRLLAASAAMQMAGHEPEHRKPLIVIDSGTAVTIDLVDTNGVFQGGVIFPGAETSFQSLFRSTGDLPNVFEQWNDVNLERAIGDSTESAIVTGVLSSQACSIRGIVDRITKTLDSAPVVFATGGGIAPIRKLLPSEWHYVDHLVLRGIAGVMARSEKS